MSLTTRCPRCSTAFRVHAEQLSARGGRVRCGKCSAVFDGVVNLVQEPLPEASLEPSPQLALFEAGKMPGPATAPSEAEREPPANDERHGVQGLDFSGKDLATRSGPPAQTHVAATAPEAKPNNAMPPEMPQALKRQAPALAPKSARPASASAGAAARAPAARVPLRRAKEPVVDWGEGPAPGRRWPWALLALLAAAALAAQIAYRFRTEISVLVPQSRPYLEAACEFADCRVRLPRHAELMSIESSDLQTHPQRSDLIVLNALLRNRAQFPQELPALELTLTDAGERPVVRRVLMPREYLERPAAGTPSLGAGAEMPVRVHFDASQVRASGYRLYLFYP